MIDESTIVLDEYEQSIEDSIETFVPVSPETKARLDAIIAADRAVVAGASAPMTAPNGRTQPA